MVFRMMPPIGIARPILRKHCHLIVRHDHVVLAVVLFVVRMVLRVVGGVMTAVLIRRLFLLGVRTVNFGLRKGKGRRNQPDLL